MLRCYCVHIAAWRHKTEIDSIWRRITSKNLNQQQQQKSINVQLNHYILLVCLQKNRKMVSKFLKVCLKLKQCVAGNGIFSPAFLSTLFPLTHALELLQSPHARCPSNGLILPRQLAASSILFPADLADPCPLPGSDFSHKLPAFPHRLHSYHG